VAVAARGQSWSEAKAMGPIERKAFLYASAIIVDKASVDWDSGRVVPAKPPSR
jgi:hypothetical protein